MRSTPTRYVLAPVQARAQRERVHVHAPVPDLTSGLHAVSCRPSQVTIIEGETGCGKSSQVPQYILDECVGDTRFGPGPRILVTQPRRVAAISLATRVAQERGEALGNAIGYRIGGARVASGQSRITFVTTGWLVQYLSHSVDAARDITHIVLDEVRVLTVLRRRRTMSAHRDCVCAARLAGP